MWFSSQCVLIVHSVSRTTGRRTSQTLAMSGMLYPLGVSRGKTLACLYVLQHTTVLWLEMGIKGLALVLEKKKLVMMHS